MIIQLLHHQFKKKYHPFGNILIFNRPRVILYKSQLPELLESLHVAIHQHDASYRYNGTYYTENKFINRYRSIHSDLCDTRV